MKRFAVLFIVYCAISTITSNALCLEALSDLTMSNISGQTTGFSEDTEQPVYSTYTSSVSYNYQDTDDQRRHSFPGEHNGTHKTILLDFIGKDATDRFGNTYRAPFSAEVHVGDIAYDNDVKGTPHPFSVKDNPAYVIFDGYANGFIQIPESYGLDTNGELILSKSVSVSTASIPDDVAGTNYICSYQGNTYTPETLETLSSDGTTFDILPNRQAQTIGEAIGGDLTILIPYEKEDGTFEWGIGAVIPEGKRYIHIDLNRMDEKRSMLYNVKLANNMTKHDDGNIESIDNTDTLPADSTDPALRSGTLGTIYMNSAMSVLGGSVFITID